MKYCMALLFFVSVVTTTTLTEGFAQTGAGRGAVGGAIIGGAVGGRRGAAIGATAGAIAGANRHHRWHNYYWRHGQCWYRSRSGRSHPVSHRYCR
jgi:outer membrane protein with glycine zipper